MKDLVIVPIALVLGLVAAVVALLVLPTVVTEIQPVSEALEDFTNRPTRTIEDNLGVVTTIVGAWAIVCLVGFILLALVVNICSTIIRGTFGLVGRGWRRTQNFRYRLGSVYGNRILNSLILFGSAFGVFVAIR